MNLVVRLFVAAGVASASAGCLDNPTDPAHNAPVAPVASCQGCPAGDWTVQWDRSRSGWSPALFDGQMTLEHNGVDWTGRIAFRQTEARPEFDKVVVDGNHVDLTFHTDREQLEISASIHGDRIIGQMQDDPSIDWMPFTGTRSSPSPEAHL
jgi:hypothetical protein